MRETLTKRQYLRRTGSLIGAAGAVGLAGCTGGSSSSNDTREILLSDGNIHIPFYLSTEVQDRFGQEDVNVEPKVVAYERSSRALSTGPSMLNPTAPAEWINIVSSDNDVALIGSELKQINGIFAPTGSDIEEPQDLEGSTLGVPFINSGTAKMMGAMLQDTYGIDIREDVESESAPPSVLYEQMLDGDSLDAVMLWTGTTVEALANDSELKQVMSATEHWTEETGEPPMILNHGVRREWLEENPGKALNYVSGWQEGVSWAFGESEVKDLYDQYGRIAGITSDAEFQTIMDLFDNERILLRDQAEWDEDLVSAQWDLYELMEETGFIDAAPSRDLGITHSELVDMADSA